MLSSFEINKKTLFKSSLIDICQKVKYNVESINKRNDDKSKILDEFYNKIPCNDKVINISEISESIINFDEEVDYVIQINGKKRALIRAKCNINQDYLNSTIKKKNINFNKGDDFNINEHLSKREGYLKLCELDMKKLLKSFRFFIKESCKNIYSDKEFSNQLMYKEKDSERFITCEKFINFAKELLKIKDLLNTLSENLNEIDEFIKKLKSIENKKIYVNTNNFLINENDWRDTVNKNNSLLEINNIEDNFNEDLEKKEDDDEGWVKVSKKKKNKKKFV